MNTESLWSPCGEAPVAPAAPATPVARHTAAKAPLVIAFHASASSARQWRTLAAHLEPPREAGTPAAPGGRLIPIDLHDHGVGPAWTTDGTARPPLTLEDEATLVAPLLAAAGRVGEGPQGHRGDRDTEGGVHLVGHSYGGAVALKVASLYPQHVRSLVLYEPVAFRLLFDDPASHAETAEALAVTAHMQTRLERDDPEGAARHFIDYWSGSGTWQAMPAPARAAVVERVPVVMQHFGALFNERQQAAAVSRLTVPVHVLVGERTVATARRIAQRLAALNSGVTLEVLPGLGHMGPVTHAEPVAAHIARQVMRHLARPVEPRIVSPALSPARPSLVSPVVSPAVAPAAPSIAPQIDRPLRPARPPRAQPASPGTKPPLPSPVSPAPVLRPRDLSTVD